MNSKLVAPLCLPPLLNDSKLISHILFTRHGARAPFYVWPSYKEQIKWKISDENKNQRKSQFIPISDGQIIDLSRTPAKGRVLEVGIEQHRKLGFLYSDYLIKQTRLISNIYNKNDIYFRSSPPSRCIESGISFMDGLFSNENESKLTHFKENESNLTHFKENSLKTNEKSQKQKLYIQIGEKGNEILVPNPEMKKFEKYTEKFVQTKEFIERYNNIPKEILKEFPQKKIDALMAADFITCLKFNDYKLPKIMEGNDELFWKLQSNLAFDTTGFINFVGKFAYGPIFDFIGERMEKKNNKFTLVSGHDCTIASVLVGLGVVDLEAPPPYASHLGIEVWEKYSPTKKIVRVVMNGDVLKIGGSETIPFDVFVDKFVSQ